MTVPRQPRINDTTPALMEAAKNITFTYHPLAVLDALAMAWANEGQQLLSQELRAIMRRFNPATSNGLGPEQNTVRPDLRGGPCPSPDPQGYCLGHPHGHAGTVYHSPFKARTK